MAGALVEESESEVVVDSRGGPRAISMQVYQDIYNQITGRTEEISKFSKKSIRATLDDVRQLDLKVNQILEQYKVVSMNSTFTIFYDKDQKETHSSIAKFSTLNSSTNGCSESVVVKYNFAIILPQAGRAQSYTITIRLINRIATQRKLFAELPMGAPRALINMISAKTCEIKISYIDYVVARTIVTAFDEWLEALDESAESKYLNFARQVSHYVPPIFKYLSLLACSYAVIMLMPILVGDKPTASQMAAFGLSAFLFIFFVYQSTFALGKFVENSVDSSSDISYLNITRGDKKLIDEVCSGNRMAIIKAALGTILTVSLNFVAKYLAVHLKI